MFLPFPSPLLLEWLVLLRKNGCCDIRVGGSDDSAPYPSYHPTTSILYASHPRHSSDYSSPHRPLSTKAQGEWLRTKIVYFSPFLKSGFKSGRFHLSLVDRNPTAFHHWMLHEQLPLVLEFWAGEHSLGSRPHSTGNPLQLRYPSLPSTCCR